ncbi:MAG: GDSL-type esterase/lipase family protein [Oscillospiraceae bacterium]
MKLKLISLFLILITLSSCAKRDCFAQEFSAQTLKSELHNSLDYNADDGFYYDILKEGGNLLNISQQRIISENFDQKELSKLKLSKKTKEILAYEKFNQQYNIMTPQKLCDGMFKGKPLYDNDNYSLNREITKAEEQVKKFILAEYSIQNSKVKKLKLKDIQVSAIKIESFMASTMPYVKADFEVTAKYRGETVTANFSDNFLLEVSAQGEEYSYSVAYPFYFDEVFKEAEFKENMHIALNKLEPTAAMQAVYDGIAMDKIDSSYKDNWLEISRYAKTISKKYIYLTQFSSDLTHQICNQNPSYLDNAVFIGDSIFEGFTYYDLAYKENVLSKIGVGARNILDMELTSKGEDYTLVQYIKKKQPQIVYIMLGLNDVNIISEKEYRAAYTEVINTIKKFSPNTDIVITSITPIRKLSFSTPERLVRYNDEARGIAEKLEGVYYLNLFDFLSQDGILSEKYSANDGIHFSAPTYKILLNFINCHQIKPEMGEEVLKSAAALQQLKQLPFTFDEKAVEAMLSAEKSKGYPFDTKE